MEAFHEKVQTYFQKISHGKVNENFKFQKLTFFSGKTQFFDFEIFIDFHRFFLISENIFGFLVQIFFCIFKTWFFKFIFHYVDPKFAKDSKNHA